MPGLRSVVAFIVMSLSVPLRANAQDVRPDSAGSSGLAVLVGGLMGGFAGGSLSSITGLDRKGTFPRVAVLEVGIIGGAIVGAHFGRRQPFPVHTALGAVPGAIALYQAIEGSDEYTDGDPFGIAGGVLLSIVGAWAGNTLARIAERRGR